MNLFKRYDAYGIVNIRPVNSTVPHLIRNHLSGEYIVKSLELNENEFIQYEIISSMNIEAITDTQRNEINQFLVYVNASLKCDDM